MHKTDEVGHGSTGRLHTNNALVLTPTQVRIIALGGRSGLKPRKDVAAWDRAHVHIEVVDTERRSWLNTTMSWYVAAVHRIHIGSPERSLVVDAMAGVGELDPAHELRTLLAGINARPVS